MIYAHTLSPEVRAALPASDKLLASPTFVLRGARARGEFSAGRLSRSRRTDAYRSRSGNRCRLA